MFTQDSAKRKIAGRWIVGVVAACSLVFLSIRHISSVAHAFSWLTGLFAPLLSGLILALVLNIPMKFFERHLFPGSRHPRIHRVRRMLGILFSLLIILGILIGIAFLVIPELLDAVVLIGQKASILIDELAQMDAEADYSRYSWGKYIARIDIDWANLKSNLEGWFQKQGGVLFDGAVAVFSSAASSVIDMVFTVIFALYILSSKEKLKAQVCRLIRAWIPERTGEHAIHVAKVFSDTFQNFMAGQVIEAMILGSLCAVGMLILGLPYAPMIGALVGVMALIPILGAYIAAFIGAFLIMTVDPFKALVFLLFLIVLQQFEGNLIYPRVVGSKIRLSAIWVLTAITVGGRIAGPLGILFGVPTVSALYALVREATEEREKRKVPLNKWHSCC